MTDGVSTAPIAAVVLAAGGSRRLGYPKQLVVMDGETLLRRTVRVALDAGCKPMVVVLGSQAELLAEEVSGLAVEVVINGEWETGMASSIRCALRPLADRGVEHVMILVCDQPLLTVETLKGLIEAHQLEAPDITASAYNGTRGVPAIFSSDVFPALMELSGDEGARKIISDPGWKVAAVDFAGGAIDIDRPSDIDLTGGY